MVPLRDHLDLEPQLQLQPHLAHASSAEIQAIMQMRVQTDLVLLPELLLRRVRPKRREERAVQRVQGRLEMGQRSEADRKRAGNETQ